VACAAAAAFVAAEGRCQELRLFPDSPASARLPGSLRGSGADVDGGLGDERSTGPEQPATEATGSGGAVSLDAPRFEPSDSAPSAVRRCVLIQCVRLSDQASSPPPSKLFTLPVTLWTSAGLLVGIMDGMMGPIHDGVGDFHFTDEGFFGYTTYGGGSDKASHFVISANGTDLLYDAFRLNRLTPDQAFWLSFATGTMAGVFVEIGDGLTPYGFSAQDLTADALGALSEALIKRHELGDTLGFRYGKVRTTIPASVIGDRPLIGINYSEEIYTADVKLGGLVSHLHAAPGFARFFLFSFTYLTKGYGYVPPLESRYQQVGMELGLNFPEILRAVGVSEATWWGDCLLRAFNFFRIPFTQVGAYYNLKNQKWYGPGAPYHFY
jgi:hypothetical protein